MEIIISKRKGSVCGVCRKKINEKYKVMTRYNTTKDYYHLSCYYNHLKKRLNILKIQIKQFSKMKYKKQMILEKL